MGCTELTLGMNLSSEFGDSAHLIAASLGAQYLEKLDFQISLLGMTDWGGKSVAPQNPPEGSDWL
jgi:hypothetical protein